MSEKLNQIEFKEPVPMPALLDVVKVDGRWAQVVYGGRVIRYLDKQEETFIDWDDFRLTKDWKSSSVSIVKCSASFTDEELKHIHWGPEQEQHPYLREEVSVFGEFEKKLKK